MELSIITISDTKPWRKAKGGLARYGTNFESVPNTAWHARQSARGPAVYPLPLAHRLVCGRTKRNTACNRLSRHSRHSSVRRCVEPNKSRTSKSVLQGYLVVVRAAERRGPLARRRSTGSCSVMECTACTVQVAGAKGQGRGPGTAGAGCESQSAIRT